MLCTTIMFALMMCNLCFAASDGEKDWKAATNDDNIEETQRHYIKLTVDNDLTEIIAPVLTRDYSYSNKVQISINEDGKIVLVVEVYSLRAPYGIRSKNIITCDTLLTNKKNEVSATGVWWKCDDLRPNDKDQVVYKYRKQPENATITLKFDRNSTEYKTNLEMLNIIAATEELREKFRYHELFICTKKGTFGSGFGKRDKRIIEVTIDIQVGNHAIIKSSKDEDGNPIRVKVNSIDRKTNIANITRIGNSTYEEISLSELEASPVTEDRRGIVYKYRISKCKKSLKKFDAGQKFNGESCGTWKKLYSYMKGIKKGYRFLESEYNNFETHIWHANNSEGMIDDFLKIQKLSKVTNGRRLCERLARMMQ